DHGETFGGIEGENGVAVFRGVDHDRGGGDGLPGERSATAAMDNGRVVPGADRHTFRDILNTARNDDAERDMSIVGGVACIECPVAGTEADFPVHPRPQVGFQAHAAYLSASAFFRVSPWPGRDRSGARHPSATSATPSKNIRSMRT